MCLTTLIVILLAIALVLRPSNCFWVWCEAPAVLEGATAKLTFYTNGSKNEFNSSSFDVQFKDTSEKWNVILSWNTSHHTFSINGNYHYYNNLPDRLELYIPNVMHNHSGEYFLTHDKVTTLNTCTLTVINVTVLASNTSNQNCLINDNNHDGNNTPGHLKLFIHNVTHNNEASANQTPNTTVSVVIAVLVTFGVTLAMITVVLYISYRYRCLFFKHRVSKQHTSEHADNGRPLMSSAVNNDHVPY